MKRLPPNLITGNVGVGKKDESSYIQDYERSCDKNSKINDTILKTFNNAKTYIIDYIFNNYTIFDL